MRERPLSFKACANREVEVSGDDSGGLVRVNAFFAGAVHCRNHVIVSGAGTYAAVAVAQSVDVRTVDGGVRAAGLSVSTCLLSTAGLLRRGYGDFVWRGSGHGCDVVWGLVLQLLVGRQQQYHHKQQ